MAISRTSRNSINTFSRFDNTSAGISTTAGAFSLQAGTSSTHYVSTDGQTWTANALTNAAGTFNWNLWSPRQNLWYFGQSSPSLTVTSRSASFTGKVRTYQNPSWNGGSTFVGNAQFLDTGVDIVFGAGGGRCVDLWGNTKWQAGNTANPQMPPAYDGGTTWAIVALNAQANGFYSTNDSSTGDGVLPYGQSASNGWSSWTSFALPVATTYVSIIYFGGFWYVITNTGAVYYTSNIATASPTWVNQGTVTSINSPFFIANNELWLLPFNGAGTSAFRVTSGGGSWNTITLPANKQCTGIAYGNGVYVISCSDGTVYRSTTGASGSFTNVATGAASTTTFGVNPIAFGAA